MKIFLWLHWNCAGRLIICMHWHNWTVLSLWAMADPPAIYWGAVTSSTRITKCVGDLSSWSAVSEPNYLYQNDVFLSSSITFKAVLIIPISAMPKGQPLILRNFVSYNGQVQLCPPDEVIDDSTYPARQVSFGIVSTYLHSFWGSLNENSSSMVGYDQTNNICKQLGFTGAVRDSARTVSSNKGQYSFTNCQ